MLIGNATSGSNRTLSAISLAANAFVLVGWIYSNKHWIYLTKLPITLFTDLLYCCLVDLKETKWSVLKQPWKISIDYFLVYRGLIVSKSVIELNLVGFGFSLAVLMFRFCTFYRTSCQNFSMKLCTVGMQTVLCKILKNTCVNNPKTSKTLR
jgi:hypothetical protein